MQITKGMLPVQYAHLKLHLATEAGNICQIEIWSFIKIKWTILKKPLAHTLSRMRILIIGMLDMKTVW